MTRIQKLQKEIRGLRAAVKSLARKQRAADLRLCKLEGALTAFGMWATAVNNGDSEIRGSINELGERIELLLLALDVTDTLPQERFRKFVSMITARLDQRMAERRDKTIGEE
jgi:hypothetical protein